MQRFDDLLRMLSGVVLGLIVRDFDDIVGRLSRFFYSVLDGDRAPTLLPRVTALILIAVFVRNLHGSSCYDEWIDRNGFCSQLERTIRGRFEVFILSVCALFGAPALAIHYLSKHVDSGHGFWWVVFALSLSIVVYIYWDFRVCWTEKDPGDAASCQMFEVAHRWLAVDAVSLLALIASWGWGLQLGSNGEAFPPAGVGICFVSVAAWTVVGDYVLNRHFYFRLSGPATRGGVPSTVTP